MAPIFPTCCSREDSVTTLAITRPLARLLHESASADMPATVLHDAKRALVNWMGAALGGCNDDSVRRALETFSEFSAPGQATVIGHDDRVDALTAALVNGISSNILDFDDTHAHIVLHPTGSIACALLALCEARPVSGMDFLHALVLGIEVEARLLQPQVADYKFAWSPTTSVAALGAAAACARALRLNETQIAWALGIAATQASGLRETGGSMSKAFNAGHAARCGLVAALLASRDFTGSLSALEGPNGFIQAFGTPRDMARVLASWGDGYHVTSNTYKAFPCGIVTHPAITACLDLHARDLRPERIASLKLTVNPMAVRLTGRRNPTGPLDAKLSVRHTAAVALVRGKVGVKEFDMECIDDPAIARLRENASVVVNDGYAMDEAEAEVQMADGSRLMAHADHAIGSLKRPMTDRALEDKLTALAENVLTQAKTSDLVARLWDLDRIGDASILARAAAPTALSANPA
jgi:2-methylcitrate dehydratase PrpD